MSFNKEMSVNLVMVDEVHRENPLEGLDEFGRMERPAANGTEILRTISLDPKAPEFIPNGEHYHVLDQDGKVVEWKKILEELRNVRDETRMDEDSGMHLEALKPTLHLKNLPNTPHVDNPSTAPPTLLYPIEEEGEVDEFNDLLRLATDDEIEEAILGEQDGALGVLVFCACGCGQSIEVKKEAEGKVEEMKRRLKEVAKGMEGLEIDGEQALYDAFVELGLLQICYDLGKAQESGKEVKKEEWVAQIVVALKGKDEETKERALSKLFAYEDCMKAELFKYSPLKPQPIPENPAPSFEWIPDVESPPYVPRTPEPDKNTNRYILKSPEDEEIQNVKAWVAELEDWIETTNLE